MPDPRGRHPVLARLRRAGRGSPISAAAVATLYNAGQFDSPIATDCLKYVWDQFRASDEWNKGGGHAFYAHLYAAQGFYMAGDQYWDAYFPKTRDQLIAMQARRRLVERRRDRRRSTAPRSPSSSCSSRSNSSRSSSDKLEKEDAILSTATEELDLAELDELRTAHQQIREQIARQIVGQDEVVEQLLIAIFARGHCILEGVPGLAKTLMVHSLAQSLSLEFNRIQFTPDLMPSDITGTEVLHEDRDQRRPRAPVRPRADLRQLILADEINRTPPKTQAALLEAMQERQVTAGGHRHALPDPFFVLATQNPIEQEGTYPLPEAQLDRFLFKILVAYPTPEEERRIYRLTTGADAAGDRRR